MYPASGINANLQVSRHPMLSYKLLATAPCIRHQWHFIRGDVADQGMETNGDVGSVANVPDPAAAAVDVVVASAVVRHRVLSAAQWHRLWGPSGALWAIHRLHHGSGHEQTCSNICQVGLGGSIRLSTE